MFVSLFFFFFLKSHLKNKDWDARAHCLDDNVFMDLLLLALQLNNREGQLSLLRGVSLKALQTLGITLRFAKPTFHLQKTSQSCHLTPDLLFCFPFLPGPCQSGSPGQGLLSSQQHACLAIHRASEKQLGTF